eukprot:2023948-Pleurochrysis_carterae.AAC.1
MVIGAAQARGLGRAWLGGGSRRERSAGRGGHRERHSESLGSGVRALRKYACDAIAKRQTVHVISRLQMKGARDDSL